MSFGAFIEVSNLTKMRMRDKQSFAAVDEISFSVPKGRVFTLLGPSGCGKTTTLRCLAGLEKPDGGEIVVDGVTFFSSSSKKILSAEKRKLGMVFQSYAIWPHMSVFDNVAYPLKIAKVPREEMRERVGRALESVGLRGLEQTGATMLSGGQQQRIALARAIVAEPKVLLLDEPLSNLDAKLRERTRQEIRELQRRLNITTVYVTHDQSEALAISDEIAVMNAGKIIQVGNPQQIYKKPSEKFVADFIGLSNFVTGKMLLDAQSNPDRQHVKVETSLGDLVCKLADSATGLKSGDDVYVAIRPEDILIASESSFSAQSQNPMVVSAKGAIKSVIFGGEIAEYRVEVNGEDIRVRTNPSYVFTEGERVVLQFQASACTALATRKM